MFQTLVFFGAGAVTFFLSNAVSGKNPKNWYMAMAEWFACSVVDHFLALLILIPLDKAAILTYDNGVQTVQFYLLGYGFFLFTAVVVGIFAAIVKKRFQIEIEMGDRKDVAANEKKKSR